MAESGAWVPGRQSLMVVVVTIHQVTVILDITLSMPSGNETGNAFTHGHSDVF